jgi:hypothetical protein
METISCPFCKEEVMADAVLCKHCRSQLKRNHTDMAIAAVIARGRVEPPAIFKPSGSEREAWCYFRFGNDKVALQQCLDDSKAEQAIEFLLENLHRELDLTFIEIVWGGGDIDIELLEEELRERFGSNRLGDYP